MKPDRRRHPLVLEDEQRAELERRCRCGSAPQRDVLRAKIVLQTAAGFSASEVAGMLRIRKATVVDWVGRFRRGGVAALCDSPRTGRPAEFGERVRLEVAALAVEDPRARKHERNRWTVRALAAELAARGGEASPKRSTVWTMLARAGIRTDRSEFWLFSKDPNFEDKVNAIAPLLADPSADELVISVDEKTSIQALSRLHESSPPGPHRARRVEHGYKRHGTVDLIAAYAPKTGEVFGVVTQGHTHLEFGLFLIKLLAHFTGKIVLVMDNLSVHKQVAIKELLASYGERVRVLFTPTHASWLNPIEAWFSILARRALGTRSFKSKEELIDALYDFIDHWNDHDKKPLKWRFRGFPTPRKKLATPVVVDTPASP